MSRIKIQNSEFIDSGAHVVFTYNAFGLKSGSWDDAMKANGFLWMAVDAIDRRYRSQILAFTMNDLLELPKCDGLWTISLSSYEFIVIAQFHTWHWNIIWNHTSHTAYLLYSCRRGILSLSSFFFFICSTVCSAESIGDTLCWARLTDLPQTKEDVQGIAYTHARESSEKKKHYLPIWSRSQLI